MVPFFPFPVYRRVASLNVARNTALRDLRGRMTVVLRLMQATAAGCVCSVTFAQGGPPLVGDDPGTPGDGHWEINLATIASHTAGVTQWALADADINYGWSDRIQLKIDTPWVLTDQSDQKPKSGLGASILGVKWRFLDGGDSALSMSTYPQWTTSFLSSSSRRGLTEPGHQLFLPLELSVGAGSFQVDAELGRAFLTRGNDSWAGGLILAHDCALGLECLLEIRETLEPHDPQTLINLGARWKLATSYALLLALGRDVGPPTESRQDILFYLGLQILR